MRILLIITLFLLLLHAENMEQKVAKQNVHTVALHQKKNYRKALSVAKKNYQFAKKKLGLLHKETLRAQSNIFVLYYALKKFETAKKFALHSLRVVRKKDAKHPRILVLLENLVELSNSLENVEDTEKFSVMYFESQKQQLGVENPKVLNTMYDIARSYFRHGKYKQAESLYSQCFKIRKKISGEDNHATLASASSLAGVYYKQGKFNSAESLLLWVIPRMQKTLGKADSSTLNAVNTLAVVFQAQGRYVEAIKYLEHCIKIKRKTLGEEHIDILFLMKNLGISYWGLDQNKKAEKIWLKCLNYWSKKDEPNKEVADLQHKLGNLYTRQGRYREAEKVLRISFKLQENLYGREHPETLLSMGCLGNLYQEINKYKEAKKLLEECSEATEKALGKKHPSTLTAINNLAELYKKQGKYTESGNLLEKYLIYARENLGKNHIITLTFMHNIAGIYKKQGKYSVAKNLYINCFQKRKALFGEKHSKTLTTQSGLGLLYLEIGKMKQAKKILSYCLKIRTQKLGKEHPSTLLSMNNMALFYEHVNEYPKAESILEECLTIKKKVLGESHPATLISMGNIALLYSDQGKHEKAKLYLIDCLKISKRTLKEAHPDILFFMADLATVYTDQKQYQKAIALYVKIIPKIQKALGRNHIKALIIKAKLANLYYSCESFQEAEKLFLECLKYNIEPNRNFILGCMNSLALVYQRQERYKDSEVLLKKCLDLEQDDKINAQISTFRHNLVGAYILQNKYKKAFDVSKNRFKKLHAHMHSLLFGSDKNVQAYFLSKQKFANDLYLSLNLQINNSNSGYNLAYFSLHNKALLLSISSQTKMLDKNLPSNIKHMSEELQEKKSLFSHLLLSPPLELEYNLLNTRKKELKEKIDSLERKIGLHSTQFIENRQKTTINDIQKVLSANEMIVDFTIFDKVNLKTLKHKERFVVAALIFQNKIKMIPIGNYQNIQNKMNKFTYFMTGKTKHKYKKEISQKLYKLLWKRIAKNLKNIKTVTIIPDATLHMLPFASLCNENGQYLLENITIETCSSLRDINIKTEHSSGNVVIFSDPDYGNSFGKTFKNLPWTAKESKQIRKLLTSKNIPYENYENKEATKENLLQVKNPQLLHLATHGFFYAVQTNKENSRGVDMLSFAKKSHQKMFAINGETASLLVDPLAYCGLVFAGANTSSTQTSILLGSEISSLSLEKTKLVTLSACETGLGSTETVTSAGKAFKAAEVFSLRRAFQEAGAKTVLSTMWSVNDKATQKFMNKFYQYYFNKISPQKAIRAVQYEFLQDKEYSHPYYWAGFVLIGTDKQFPDHTKNVTLKTKLSFYNIAPFILGFLLVIIVCCFALISWLKQKKLIQERQIRREIQKQKKEEKVC